IVEFERVAAGLKAMLPTVDIETGYLEFARPVIRDGLEKLASRGARRILALPGIELRFGRDLSIEPKLLKVAAARIAEAEGDARRPVARAETLLLVVGRGTSDPDANSNIAKITRMLWEGMGFGWAETAFSGVAHPLVEPGLRRAAMLGFRHIVVFPYFLFT